VYIYNLVEKRNVYSNDGIKKLLGFGVGEIQKMGEKLFPELLHPDDFDMEDSGGTLEVVLENTALHEDKAYRYTELKPGPYVQLRVNVMFAPLILEGKTVGIIGLANKNSDFDDNDAKMAGGFGELAAIALQNSWHLDERINAEKQREKVIEELKIALSEVKKLSGLLPICSHCKKIRDDEGYWNQIESYITKHSDAKFSHCICQECLKKFYPDFDFDAD